ncbi:MAG: hypothetical protein AAFS04_00745 [Cyanobacteria bacterium J06631_9]
MTPREELIGSIESLPDELVKTILALVKVWQRQLVSENAVSDSQKAAESQSVLERMGGEPKHMLAVGELSDREHRQDLISRRLRRKQGVLVVETGALSKVDTNALVAEMREERIQGQIDQVVS